MSPMAVSPRQLLVVGLAAALLISACSNSDDSGLPTLEEATESAETSTTTSTEATTTTSTEPTTTTLSELRLAEAEIRAVVTEWHQFPVDSSLGEVGLGLEQTTGLLRQRILEFAAELEAEGRVLRGFDNDPIAITQVTVDLIEGAAEVDACVGSATQIVDADTSETITADDPNDTAVATFQMLREDDGWKVGLFLPSALNGGAIECQINP